MNRQPILRMSKCSETSARIVGGNPPKPPALPLTLSILQVSVIEMYANPVPPQPRERESNRDSLIDMKQSHARRQGHGTG